jgi:hypothetical protein
MAAALGVTGTALLFLARRRPRPESPATGQ